jgi:hypothetical protein
MAKTIRRARWSKTQDGLLRKYSKAKTRVSRISKEMKRTIAALRVRANKLGIPLGHRR